MYDIIIHFGVKGINQHDIPLFGQQLPDQSFPAAHPLLLVGFCIVDRKFNKHKVTTAADQVPFCTEHAKVAPRRADPAVFLPDQNLRIMLYQPACDIHRPVTKAARVGDRAANIPDRQAFVSDRPQGAVQPAAMLTNLKFHPLSILSYCLRKHLSDCVHISEAVFLSRRDIVSLTKFVPVIKIDHSAIKTILRAAFNFLLCL